MAWIGVRACVCDFTKCVAMRTDSTAMRRGSAGNKCFHASGDFSVRSSDSDFKIDLCGICLLNDRRVWYCWSIKGQSISVDIIHN